MDRTTKGEHRRGLVLALALSVSYGVVSGQERSPRVPVTFPTGIVVRAEVVQTPEEREAGLQHRATLAENQGMLFIFEEDGMYSFWMKDTLISLDISWLDAEKRIVSFVESVPPCRADPCPSYRPSAKARYVLETVAGFNKKHAVKVGDRLTFDVGNNRE